MNVVDSSAWLEYFADGPNAKNFALAIETTNKLIVPSICLFEVFKRIFQQRDEESAIQAVASMKQGKIIDLDFSLSIASAKISAQLKLPIADSIVYTTALSHNAIVWTQDSDFEKLEGVRYFRK